LCRGIAAIEGATLHGELTLNVIDGFMGNSRLWFVLGEGLTFSIKLEKLGIKY
jgi:hypothetical protein